LDRFVSFSRNIFDAHNFGAFEEIYRIPLVMAGPGVAPGKVSPGLVQFGDLCPTILELAGAELMEEIDFRSIKPLLEDPEGRATDFFSAYGEYHGTRFPLCQRILWEGDWKFVFNGFDFDELYDLASDPGEMTNLAARPEHRGRVERMMASIWRRVRESGDHAILESHYLSMRFAAVGPDAE
ncbi:MAG: sulfatase/phosphatase domain-containing protein, partial [Verrucomicrobiales bacterium]